MRQALKLVTVFIVLMAVATGCARVTGKSAGGPVAVTAIHAASGKSGSASVTVAAASLISLGISGAEGVRGC